MSTTSPDRASGGAPDLHELADQLPHPVWVAEPDGTLTYCSRRLLEYSGLPPDRLRHWGATPLLHPEDRARTRASWERALETGGDWAVEHRLRRADGEYRWHLTLATPARDGDGSVAAWHGSSTDIHDRIPPARAGAQREGRFREVFEHAHDAILVFGGDDWVITDANPAAEGLYACERGCLGQLTLLHLCEDPDRARASLELLRDRGSAQFELAQRTRDGRTVHVEINAARMNAAGGGGFLAIMRDLTERRELERQLQRAQKMEAVGRLAGGLAHDFNNLTTAIRGFTALLQDELSTEPAAAEALAEIDRAAERASGLTRQLLAYTRQQVLRPRVLDLNDVVTTGRGLLRRLIGEDVELVTALDPGIAPVRADPGQLQQVVMNLAVNARDAMPEGGTILFETRNILADGEFADAHHPMEPGPYVELRVADTGLGMDGAVRRRIFEPFFTTKDVGEGTGLGLSTVYGIVKQSGGFIWVESEPGEGTTFVIHLPAVDGVVERVEEPADLPAPPPHRRVDARRISRTILLVEDEDGVRKLTRRVLERHGYRVLEAGDGEEGLEVARTVAEPIHLLLTDLIMPRLSGKDLARAIAARSPAMPVLFMSGYTGESLHERGELEPADRVLQKPFRPMELARTVQEMLGDDRLESPST